MQAISLICTHRNDELTPWRPPSLDGAVVAPKPVTKPVARPRIALFSALAAAGQGQGGQQGKGHEHGLKCGCTGSGSAATGVSKDLPTAGPPASELLGLLSMRTICAHVGFKYRQHKLLDTNAYRGRFRSQRLPPKGTCCAVSCTHGLLCTRNWGRAIELVYIYILRHSARGVLVDIA